ncbi:MAG: hypothetical protein HY262_03160 [Chloroflexi bacterium]|nr:hypothetical protein [Chloroflexota bacterium]
MHIINTDGLALIGPGSEWLWTALQFFALSFTGLAILRQVRLQATSNSLAMGVRFADSFRIELTRFKAVALIDVARDSRVMTPAIDRVGSWFDGTASGIHNGHLPALMGWQEWGVPAQMFWAAFGPALHERRKLEPGQWKEWEHWLGDVIVRDRKAGIVQDVSQAAVARWIPEAIAYYIEALRLSDEDRRGVIPTWPIPEPSSESTDKDLPT